MANDIKSSEECLKAVSILFEELKNAKGKRLDSFLPYFPRVRGFIHGHIHRWDKEW